MPTNRTLRAVATVVTLLLLPHALAASPTASTRSVIDLTTSAGVAQVNGVWRWQDARISEVEGRAAGPDRKPSGAPVRTHEILPRAGTLGFDDSSWQVIAPEDLDERRSTGRVCFCWYRLKLTVPERVDEFPVTGSRMVFEIVVDDYAEIWVNGALPRQIGQSGGSVVAGWNTPNRLVLSERAKPGDLIEIAVFAMNGPISDAPQNFIWVRSAQLEFLAPASMASPVPPPLGSDAAPRVVRLNARLDALIAPETSIDCIASGFAWLEGPAWSASERALYFSDIPANAVYRVSPGDEPQLAVRPSGYSGTPPYAGREPGSNGLMIGSDGLLYLCQHGDRRIARREADGRLTPIVERYQGRRLNSPNDLTVGKPGELYFTDPPFGLPQSFQDPARELDFCGVYRLSTSGELTLVSRAVPAPNGLALSPDSRTLYVSNAEQSRPVIFVFTLDEHGNACDQRVFFDASPWVEGRSGVPDGIKVDALGNVFAAGPGGIHVLAGDGTHLGLIETGVPTSNCAFGEDGRALYITANTSVLRVPLCGRSTGSPGL
ncbi:MAG: SMP-30/gluconolactonase/LRE family protein [Planctomycetota bacterium]